MELQETQRKSLVSIVTCKTYDVDVIREAVLGVLVPLGGMQRFVRPGMRVLLKPNLLTAAGLDRAVTTHPAVVRAVAEQVVDAGGTVLIGDSPGGPIKENPQVWRASGMVELAEREAVSLAPFGRAVWRRLDGSDYFVAPPVMEADLVINLPKLKTHVFALYTGAVKNLFGVIPGTRKRELHCRAPGITAFGEILADVLELVKPGLTIMDGVLGQEGNGPGVSGTPHLYGCLVAGTDAVAVDAVVSEAMGYRRGEVLHLEQASRRGLGISDPESVRLVGEGRVPGFGRLRLPRARWYFGVPSWVGVPLRRAARVRPRLDAAACKGCGECVDVCPKDAIAMDPLPVFDLDACVDCLCCIEICPCGAIRPQRSLVAKLAGIGR